MTSNMTSNMSFSPLTSKSSTAAKDCKSAEALRLEQAAIFAFDTYRTAHPSSLVKFQANLLGPSHHLTCACWSTFSKYVRSHPGWLAKRRVATEEEKTAANVTSSDKRYWIDVKFDPVRAIKMTAASAAKQLEVAPMHPPTQDSKRSAENEPSTIHPAKKPKGAVEDISNDDEDTEPVEARVTP